METPFVLIAPVLGIVTLLALPLVAGEGEKSWHRRPLAVLVLVTVAVSWATLTRLGTYTPWSPQMDAWSGLPLPQKLVHAETPLERQGAIVFQDKQVPQLPRSGRHGRPAGSSVGHCSSAAYRGSISPPGNPGRQEHAGLWDEPEPL
jgi:ubiquinol-cytochrome c reductase cytochrome b subunit